MTDTNEMSDKIAKEFWREDFERSIAGRVAKSIGRERMAERIANEAIEASLSDLWSFEDEE
jgi:hypothetical protein